MKKALTYTLFVLLLSLNACNEIGPESEHLLTIGDLEIVSEKTSETRALGAKDDFGLENGLGDRIYVYGWSKAFANGPRTRFMPEESAIDARSGATYTYSKDEPSGWQRFIRTVPGGDNKIPYWRPSFYHDFAGYYYYDRTGFTKPISATDEIAFVMAANGGGLVRRELLWGETTNYLFTGESQVIPRILFKHQLSRIRVEMLHDMDDVATDNFAVSSITLDIDRTENLFYTQTGLWKNDTPTTYTLVQEWPDPNPLRLGTDIPAPRLETFPIHEWWVLPGCEISNFVLNMYKSAALNTYPMSFKDIFDDSNVTVTTKPGYITVIRVKFGDIKPIIFSVTLDPWKTVSTNVGNITDGNLIN